jgi:hypothetical protein
MGSDLNILLIQESWWTIIEISIYIWIGMTLLTLCMFVSWKCWLEGTIYLSMPLTTFFIYFLMYLPGNSRYDPRA